MSVAAASDLPTPRAAGSSRAHQFTWNPPAPPPPRHYIRDLAYGANDGIITTFAVVAGGEVSTLAALVVGVANLAADGVSMGIANLLAIRVHETAYGAGALIAAITRGGI